MHAKGDVALGMARHRKLVPWQSIPSLVAGMSRFPVYRNAIAADAFPREFARIKARSPYSAGPPQNELIWNAAVLAEFVDQISQYIPLRDQFNCQLGRGNYDLAGETLDRIEELFGYSLWLISAKLTLLHLSKGVKSQKAYLHSIMDSADLGAAPAYLSYFFSYSLEDGVSAAEVRREFALDEGGLVGLFLRYFRYHVIPFDLEHVNDPIGIIRLEESSPIIDRFETFVEMAQILCFRQEQISPLRESIKLISSLDDIRVKNIQFYLNNNVTPQPLCDSISDAIEAYTLDRYSEADDLLRSENLPYPKAWTFELLARTSCHSGSEVDPTTLDDRAISAMRAFLDVMDDRDEVVATLHKIAFLTRKSPASRSIGCILDRTVDATILKNPTANEAAWFTGIPLLIPHAFGAHVALDDGIGKRIEHGLRSGTLTTSAALQLAAVRGGAATLQDLSKGGLPLSRATLYESYAYFNAENYEQADAALRRHGAIVDDRLSPRTLGYQYELYRRLNQPMQALRAFSAAYLNNQRAIALYPIEEFVEWSVSVAEADEGAVDRSLLLHAYSQNIGPSRDGDLSDSCEDVLDYYELSLPSDLVGMEISRDKLVYFLRHVATVERLEDTTLFNGVDEIEAERIRILQWLIDADPANRVFYTQEIAAITKDQEVARLTAQFERSKIYVHEDGIRRKLKSDIEGSFERYRQILSEPIFGNSLDAIEQRFRKILREDSNLAFIVIPSMERQSMFHALIQQIYDLLVLDPSHGFKTYLSTRILHGVLEGELRASFVNENLLSALDTEDTVSEFKEMWQERLGAIPNAPFSALANAGERFSSRVQDAISDLKDTKIRVWNTEEYRQGLFKIILTDYAFERLRESVTSTTQFQEFLDRVIASFWESMDDCLRAVVVELNGPFAKKIRSAFDQLETALSSSDLTPYAGELKDALARCRSSFAHDLARISAWFVRGGVISDEPFSLPVAVQVATLITNNCYPKCPLDPKVESSDIMLAGAALNPIIDLLTNCLQNAAEHSLFPNAPADVEIVATMSTTGLCIAVRSTFSEDVDIGECRREIDQLVSERDAVNPQAVAQEGKTGIRKIKRILQHDLRTPVPLKIDVNDDRSVTAAFTIPSEYVDERRHN